MFVGYFKTYIDQVLQGLVVFSCLINCIAPADLFPGISEQDCYRCSDVIGCGITVPTHF